MLDNKEVLQSLKYEKQKIRKTSDLLLVIKNVSSSTYPQKYVTV